MVLIFAGDNRGHSPCLSAVTRRKGVSTIEELAALTTLHRASTLSNSFESGADDEAVNQRLCTQESRFSRPRIVLLAAEQIESAGDRTQCIHGTGVTDSSTHTHLTISFSSFVARD